MCRYSSYPEVHVTVTGTSTINGNVEISASSNSAGSGFSLALDSGSFAEGKGIVIDASATAALVATPDVVSVTRKDAFNGENEPTGYKCCSTSASSGVR